MENIPTVASPPLETTPRRWAQALARYREPNHVRSIVEIAITVAPLAALWTLAWAAIHFEYWWIALLLAVPAAGFLVRLFMIQHDCGHGSFFRQRAANDWVGRVIGVLTLTPYDFWRHTHAIHHASSGHLEWRGIGDVDTLTVGEYLSLSFWGRLRYRAYRHPLVMFCIGPAYLFILRHRLPVGLIGSGWQPWLSTMATNVTIAGIAAGLICSIGVGPFVLVELPTILLAGSIGGMAVLRSTSVRDDVLGPCRRVDLSRGGSAWQLTLRFAWSLALVHCERRRAPCPSPMQPHSLLPATAGAPRPSRALQRKPTYAASELPLCAPRAMGRESAASRLLS